MKKDYKNALKSIQELVTYADNLNFSDNRLKNIPHHLNEIKKKILIMKPILQQGEDVSRYVDDIKSYFENKIATFIQDLNNYEKNFISAFSEIDNAK